ncbi:hypothetical protein G7Z17_g10821 [Cylindrodendrum hubeiense]|uniref:Photolyase/cryptochrome alpha/beta domain-containing protein n=1 Tax=Cylindrodendrum hubeiense TaxID=595255 RepID=A0A9P5LCA3_9HYPO|nr:hypothetical protein G7Z17_g10821 [Cylindrodendrum hubeiense]
MTKPRVIYWFRTDLRLHDSPALKAALDLDPAVLWPIFTWDPYYVYRARGGLNRWQFLLDCQNDLSESITKLNPKSKLFVLREAPQTLFPKLFKAWKVTHLVFEKDTDAYARERDGVVIQAAQDAGVEVIIRSGRTLWDSDQVVEKHGGKPTMSITQLQAAGKRIGDVRRPIPAPEHLPDPGDVPVNFEQDQPETTPDLNSERRTEIDVGYNGIAGPNGDFAIETMEELGFPSATTPHRGGETIALKMLDKIIKDKRYTATFQKPMTSPAQFEPQSTTFLSPFLHFGSLSVREFYWRVQDVVKSFGKGASSPPESLIGQLLFRDIPIAFGQKWDKQGNFIRRWVPELSGMDEKYIYEPWKAPLPDQKRAGVRIKGDGLTDVESGTYPKPMFDFSQRRTVCLASMKTAYSASLYGNDNRVLDGTWREMFPVDGGTEMQGKLNRSDDKGDLQKKKHGESTSKRGAGNGNIGEMFKKQKTL